MRILRPLLVLIVLAAPACMRWEGARIPAPAADPPAQVASGPVAHAVDGPAVETGDSGDRATRPGIGQAPALQPAQAPVAERREAGPLTTTVAIVAVIAAGAFAVFLLLAHVNC